MSKQSELISDYKRARKNALARAKSFQKKYGVDVSESIPPIPKRITQGSINRVNKLTSNYFKEHYEEEIEEYRNSQDEEPEDNYGGPDYIEDEYVNTDTGEIFPQERIDFLIDQLYGYADEFTNDILAERWRECVSEGINSRGRAAIAMIMDDESNEEKINDIFNTLHNSYEDNPNHAHVMMLFNDLTLILGFDVPLGLISDFMESSGYDSDYASAGMTTESDGRYR